jgi:hypothetical protein
VWLVVVVWLGVVVCCVDVDPWLGVEVWAGALAWGAGALFGADAVFFWAIRNAGTNSTRATKIYFRRPPSLIGKFIANS